MFDIFSPDGRGWPGFPKRSYAKLDQVEPFDAAINEGTGSFALEVVDADWHEFASGGRFDLSDTNVLQSSVLDYWAYLFRIGSHPSDPFSSAPAYRIEISASRGDAWYKDLANLSEEEWVLVELDEEGPLDADVFGALLQLVPVPAHLKKITRSIPQTKALNIIFSPDTWPNATDAEIEGALSNIPALDYLIGIDVGQGAAIGLADQNEDIQAYFDLGGGVYRNTGTRPPNLQFCWRKDAPIVLSHWDADHWSGHISDAKALPRTWIAPRQNMTTKSILFVNKMLLAGGKLRIWGTPAPASISVPVGGGTQTLKLLRCSGPTNKRNGSGIAVVVENIAENAQWLLTGDAAYDEISPLPSSPVAIVVPHHGADMGRSSVPPSKPASYARLFYSFGPGNRHGRHPGVQHPTSAAMAAHASWNHGSWTAASPGYSTAGAEVLASASHTVTHLDGAVMGWSAAPTVPLHSFPCGGGSGCTCSGRMTQS